MREENGVVPIFQLIEEQPAMADTPTIDGVNVAFPLLL